MCAVIGGPPKIMQRGSSRANPPTPSAAFRKLLASSPPDAAATRLPDHCGHSEADMMEGLTNLRVADSVKTLSHPPNNLFSTFYLFNCLLTYISRSGLLLSISFYACTIFHTSIHLLSKAQEHMLLIRFL